MVERALASTLLPMVEARQQEGIVVLAFANHAYLEVLLNWLVAMNRLEIDNFVIVSLDEELHDYLSEKAIPSVLSPLQGGLDQLWVKRIGIFRYLMDQGIAFIHSDIDAIWLRNPIPAYFSRPAHDLIISQGTIWPADVVRKRGFVFCCGLFYLQGSESARRLLGEMESDVRSTGDDQVTLNRVIESYGVQWEINKKYAYGLKHRDTTFYCSRRPITGISTTSAFKICLLPHHEFQRMHMPDEEAYVKHLISPKTAESKLELFRKSNCLFLRPDWRVVDFDAESLGKLAAEPRL
jgi:hypothetical protein